MKKLLAAACAAAVLLISGASAFAGKCVRVHGNTPAEALEAGMKAANEWDSEGVLDASTQVRILPDKENGKYVAEVYTLPRKSPCELHPEYKVADVVEP
uniref:hypothetical protein n=1 Tax=Candidatus Electronema sp. TaxID=2698783 RepID=UPI0040574FBB